MIRKRAVDLLDAKHDPAHKELPPRTKTRFHRGQVKRRRRCVRIEVVTSDDRVIDGYALEADGWWVRIGALRPPDSKFSPSMESAHRTLRRIGYSYELTRTRIRKVYEEAT